MTTNAKRRFFRYSLRTLMLAVTVFCILMGITAKRARDQRQAVEAIRALGGTVRYEHEPKSEPPGPEWLRQLIGDEYFFSVRQVRLRGSHVNDANLAAIKQLTDLKIFTLIKTKVTDTGLKHLKGLINLEDLDIVDTEITDAGLEHLKGLTNLQMLSVSTNNITDAGLVHLKGLANLQILYLMSTQITDVGLEHLTDLTNLRKLSLSNTQVTDEGARKLQQVLPNCEIHLKDNEGLDRVLLPATSSPTPQP